MTLRGNGCGHIRCVRDLIVVRTHEPSARERVRLVRPELNTQRIHIQCAMDTPSRLLRSVAESTSAPHDRGATRQASATGGKRFHARTQHAAPRVPVKTSRLVKGCSARALARDAMSLSPADLRGSTWGRRTYGSGTESNEKARTSSCDTALRPSPKHETACELHALDASCPFLTGGRPEQ